MVAILNALEVSEYDAEYQWIAYSLLLAAACWKNAKAVTNYFDATSPVWPSLWELKNVRLQCVLTKTCDPFLKHEPCPFHNFFRIERFMRVYLVSFFSFQHHPSSYWNTSLLHHLGNNWLKRRNGVLLSTQGLPGFFLSPQIWFGQDVSTFLEMKLYFNVGPIGSY